LEESLHLFKQPQEEPPHFNIAGAMFTSSLEERTAKLEVPKN
jgi:hypothetical protein